MTWSINMHGADDLTGEAKESLERELVQVARSLASDLAEMEGLNVTAAVAVTNTTGSVDLRA